MKQGIEGLNKKPGRYGILGGTFDPIHNGHLYIAQKVLEELELDQIIFVPNHISPHKLNENITSADHRVEMVKTAICDNKGFGLSTIEIYREGPSYTIETIRKLITDYPEGTVFYFITGADVFVDFHTWKDYDQLLKLIHFVIVTREGHQEKLDEKINYFTEYFNGDIIKLDVLNLEISSTYIRQQVQEGKQVKYLVPSRVADYMHAHGLYKR